MAVQGCSHCDSYLIAPNSLNDKGVLQVCEDITHTLTHTVLTQDLSALFAPALVAQLLFCVSQKPLVEKLMGLGAFTGHSLCLLALLAECRNDGLCVGDFFFFSKINFFFKEYYFQSFLLEMQTVDIADCIN